MAIAGSKLGQLATDFLMRTFAAILLGLLAAMLFCLTPAAGAFGSATVTKQPVNPPSISPVFTASKALENKAVLGLRYLNPDSGRFWSQDKYEGTKFDPNSQHKYLYAQADPVNGIDPSGEYTLSEIMEAVGIDKNIQRAAANFARQAAQRAGRKIGCDVAKAAAAQGVYVLVLGDGSLYVGQSNDIKRRFGEHLRDLEKAGAKIVGYLKITTGIENARAAKYLREIFEAFLIKELNPAGNKVGNPVGGSNRLLKYADPVQAGIDELFKLTPFCK
jgi:RHS repeat-associated protein